MGFTVGQDQGAYEDADATKEVEAPEERYAEEGTTGVERGDFVGTLDTTTVGAGDHEDLRNVSATFDRADATLAQRLEDEDEDADDGIIIENQGERSREDIVDSLRDGVAVDPSGGANPVEGDPGTGQDVNDQKTEESEADAEKRQEEANQAMLDQARQDAAAGFGTDADKDVVATGDLSTAADPAEDPETTSADEVVKGNVSEVEDHLKEHPESADDVLAAEQALAKSEERDVRAGVEKAVDKYRLFDPSKHNVGETKEYFDSADDDEVARVKAIESDGQARPGIMNWERPAS